LCEEPQSCKTALRCCRDPPKKTLKVSAEISHNTPAILIRLIRGGGGRFADCLPLSFFPHFLIGVCFMALQVVLLIDYENVHWRMVVNTICVDI